MKLRDHHNGLVVNLIATGKNHVQLTLFTLIPLINILLRSVDKMVAHYKWSITIAKGIYSSKESQKYNKHIYAMRPIA